MKSKCPYYQVLASFYSLRIQLIGLFEVDSFMGIPHDH